MTRTRLLGILVIAASMLGLLFAASAQAHKCECAPPLLFAKGKESRFVTKAGAFRSSQDEGRFEFAATSASGALLFEAVEAPGGAKCESAGEPSGKVRTSRLTAELGWISRSRQEVGLDLKPGSAANVAEFECEGLAVKLKGSVIAHLSPINVSTIDMRLDFFGSEGATFRNEPSSVEGAPSDVLTTEFSTAPGVQQETVWQQSDVEFVVHGNSTVCKIRKGVEKCKPEKSEVNTIANAASPEFGHCRKKGRGVKYADANCTTPAEKGKYSFVPAPG